MVKSFFRFLSKGVLPPAFLAACIYAAYLMLDTPPKAHKSKPGETAPAVGVAELVARDTDIFIEAFGTVVPSREVVVRTEVGGRALRVHENLVPGGVIVADATLLHIDPSDYEIAARGAQARLVQAQTEIDIEQGQQIIARRGWELLKDELNADAANRDLALRKPQLERAEAARAIAEAQLAKAELDLARTAVLAPFDAMVLEESVEVGQLVDRQAEVATLVGTDEYWIRASIPLKFIDRVRIPVREGERGSRVRVRLSTGATAGSEATYVREGEVVRLLGDLDPEGRMARVLISVKDPLNLESAEDETEAHNLLLGSYVRLEIEAGTIHDAYSIPRTALRENSKVWLHTPEGTLDIRDVDILWRRGDDVLVADAFSEGEGLIISRLANIMPGMKVRKVDRPAPLRIDDEPPETTQTSDGAPPTPAGAGSKS